VCGASILSLQEALLWRTLPLPEPDRLFFLKDPLIALRHD
jgi:hypothetical protein